MPADAEVATKPPGPYRAGGLGGFRRALAAAAVASAAIALTACGVSSPSGAPSSSAGAVVQTAPASTAQAPRQPGETGANGSQGIVSKLKATPGGIGYVGVSYESEITGDSQLGMAALGNSSGNYELPTGSAIDAGLASFTNTPANEAISLINGSEPQAYPIINYEYAIVNTAQASATLARDIQAFLYWTITSGTTRLASVNFQPLPAPVVTLSEAQIATIRG